MNSRLDQTRRTGATLPPTTQDQLKNSTESGIPNTETNPQGKTASRKQQS